MNQSRVQHLTRRYPFLFALLLLLLAGGVNLALQRNLLEQRVLAGNLRVFMPLILLAVGQTIVIIGGGIDLSLGNMVSLGNAIMVTMILQDSSPDRILLGMAVTIGAGLLAGAFNGWAVAYLRLQPIVTTYATGFIYAGLALLILPRPGGQLPRDFLYSYREAPLGIPFQIYLIALVILFWLLLRSTRYGQFLYATGGKADSAYATGVAVNRVRFSTYVWAGLFAALAAITLSLNIGTGNPRIGEAMTLDSIVAVVLGGTRLSGGQGGVIGSVVGVLILGLIRNIISFANVPTWSQTLVDALIIIVALAGPGLVRLLRRQQPS